MNSYSRSLISLFFINVIFVATIKAQSYFTLASSSYAYSSKSYLPKNNTFQNEALAINLPLKLKKEDKLLVGLAYHRLSLRFEPDDVQQHYYHIGNNFGYIKKTAKGSLLFLVLARGNSDFYDLNWVDFQFGGLVLITKKKNDKLTIKYGLYYNSELFGPFFVPLYGLDWKVAPKIRIFGLMPQNLVIENKINSIFRWGFMYQSPSYTYYINTSTPNLYLHNNATKAGLFADFYATKSLVAQIKVDLGYFASYRTFETSQRFKINFMGLGFEGRRSENKTPVQELTHGLFFQFGIHYRVEL